MSNRDKETKKINKEKDKMHYKLKILTKEINNKILENQNNTILYR